MKKLITSIALGLITLHAQAGTMAVGKSRAGNIVNLNDTTSKNCEAMGSDWSYAESLDADGFVDLKGCWAIFDDKVKIRWITNDGYKFEAVWSAGAFNRTQYFDRNYGNKADQRAAGSL